MRYYGNNLQNTTPKQKLNVEFDFSLNKYETHTTKTATQITFIL